MRYELQWLRAWSLVVGIGIGIALLWWPFWAVVAQTVVPIALCWMLLVTSTQAVAPPWRLVAARAFVLGGALGATRAFADLCFPVTALVVVVAALSSPPVVRWLHRHGLGTTDRQLDPENEARLEAWTLSTRALAAATTETDRLAVVRSRQSMLDAWEELDPAGFAAWLATPHVEH